MPTSGPALTGAKVAAGATGTSHSIMGSDGNAFVAGQTIWLSFFYNATRVTGTNTMTLVAKIHWYNASGGEVAGSPTSSPTITINASTTGWVFSEAAHTAPAGAVSSRPEIVATPAASPMQHDLIVTRIRGSKSQTLANYVTNTNQLTDGANLGQTAVWSNVTGSNRPADNATVNNTTYSPTQPSSPVNGDIWVDTSVNPNVTKIRVGGAWQIASNYTTNSNQLTDGAGWSTTATWNNVGSRPTELTDGRISTALDGSGQVRSAALGDANRVRFTRMEGGTTGWGILYNPWGIASQSSNQTNGYQCAILTCGFTGGSQQASIGTNAFASNAYKIPVTPNERIFASARIGTNFASGLHTWSMNISFMDINGNSIGGGAQNINIGSGGGITFGTRYGTFVTVPSNAYYAWLECYLGSGNSTGGTSSVYVMEPMVCSAGIAQTAWPAFTPGHGYEAGATVGASWGSNLTGRPSNLSGLSGTEAIQNTQISVNSYGALSGIGNGNNTYVANFAAAIGTNQLTNSDFSRGMLGFIPTANSGNTPYTGSVAINTLNSAYAGYRNVLQCYMPTSGAAWSTNGQYWDACVSKGTWNGGGYQDLLSFAMRVKAGDNVYARCLGAQHRCTFQLYLLITDKNGTLVEAPSWFGARDGGGVDGNPANFNEMGGTWTVQNSGAAYAFLLFRMLPNGGADPWLFIAEPAMGRLPAGQIVLPPYSVGPTDSALTVAGSGYTVGDQRNLLPITVAGTRYKYTGTFTYTSTAGSGSATISSAGGNLVLGSTSISYSNMSQTVSGSIGSTVTYYLYVASNAYFAGSHALGVTTDGNVVYNNDNIVYLGSISVFFPAAGGGTSGGGGDGGGVGCVAEDAWVETRDRGFVLARDVLPADSLRCLDEETMEGTIWLPVRSNKVVPQPCSKITSESGITLRLSESTPLTLKDGSAILVPELDGHELPVQDGDDFRWEPCHREPLGMLNVCYISLGGYVYAAGDEKGRSILTHNPTQFQKP